MSDIDELSTELRELRDATATVSVPAPPQLAAIAAQGRRFRRRRRVAVAGTSLACATAGTALALNLINGAGPSPVSDPAPAPGSEVPARIHTAAFTLVSNQDGTVSLTIDPSELFEPSVLENDLARYGIPALVTVGTVCTSDPAPAGLSEVESFEPGGPGENGTITIDPSALPAGSEVSFGTLDLKGDVRASYSSLIDANSYTCAETPPNDAEPHPARQAYIRLGPSN
jgi:hypothetical protein